VNNNPAIGLDTIGRGDISFITDNRETTPLRSSITMTPVSETGCTGTPKPLGIVVNPQVHIRAIANDSLFCEGSDIRFDVINKDELNNIQWVGPDSFSSSASNPNIMDVYPNHSGMYVVTAKSHYDCNAVTDTVFIHVLDEVILDLDDTLFICNSAAVIESDATNAETYLWSTGETTKNIVVHSTGEYWVSASNKRCQAMDTTVVAEIDISYIEIQTTGDLCKNGAIDLYVDSDMDNLSYCWSTGDITNKTTIHTDGYYGIVVSFKGCITLQNIHIECPCDFWAANMFTVNGDGLNDIFLPIPMTKLNTFSMFIYDRWGNIIFETNTYSPWDGTYKGQYAKADTYVYVIYYTCAVSPGNTQRKQGRITLVR
jgi:gliding motility-associated-like protein